VLVDTTPELRLQAVANGVKRVDAVVYTHAHADHIMGLDDVRRFNAIKGGALDVWADAKTHKTLMTCFGYAFKEPEPELKLFRPHLEWREILHDRGFELGGVEWTPVPLVHGAVTVLGFRLRRAGGGGEGGGGGVAYCTDVNHIPEESYKLLEGVEVLILDALQWKKHATHFTVEEAVEAARRIGAKQTWFTHAAHGVSHAEANGLLPGEMQFAYDGQVIRVKI
jgi:phosphoribosyl 1,2-cyclic phosphate phosphodiesterase